MASPSKQKPVILVDSREQRPWTFSDRVKTRKVSLKYGDYSLGIYDQEWLPDGLQYRVAIERKSFADLVHTVVHERDRFEIELQHLRDDYKFAWVVVEGPWESIVLGRYGSKIKPQSLRGMITALMADYIPILFAGIGVEADDRNYAMILAEDLLVRAHKRLTDD